MGVNLTRNLRMGHNFDTILPGNGWFPPKLNKTYCSSVNFLLQIVCEWVNFPILCPPPPDRQYRNSVLPHPLLSPWCKVSIVQLSAGVWGRCKPLAGPGQRPGGGPGGGAPGSSENAVTAPQRGLKSHFLSRFSLSVSWVKFWNTQFQLGPPYR